MIQKALTAYCDECALQQPLVSQTLKEAATELPNMGWEIAGKEHYCSNCSMQRQMKIVNPAQGEE
jgi:hypothetical protein